MTPAWWAEQCSIVAAALAIVTRSAHRPPLRPLAACLATVAALDLFLLTEPPRWAAVAAWAAWYIGQGAAVAAGLGWPRRALVVVALSWWAVEVARVLVPPGIDGDALKREWWALWAVATVAQVAAVGAWAWGAYRARQRPTEGQAIALVLAAGSVADAVGPWAAGAGGAWERWEVARWQSAGTWLLVVAVALWHWRRSRPS